MKMETKNGAKDWEKLVLILHRQDPTYSIGSDRILNARSFVREMAKDDARREAFISEASNVTELHPDTVRSYVNTAKEAVINEMEIRAEGTNYRFYDWSCKDVYDTKEEAVAAAEKLRVAREEEDFQRFTCKKEDSRRTWAWNCSYYRRQISDAKKSLAYAEARLGICLKNQKTVPVPDTTEAA